MFTLQFQTTIRISYLFFFFANSAAVKGQNTNYYVNYDKSGKFGGDIFKIMYFQFFTSLANSVMKKAKYIIFNFWYFLIFGRFSNDQYTKSMRII